MPAVLVLVVLLDGALVLLAIIMPALFSAGAFG
jgi:hypothetical protein